MRLALLLLWTAAAAFAAVCEPLPAVKQEIDRLPPWQDENLTAEQFVAPRRALAERYPEDLYAQTAAMRLPTQDVAWERQIERYRAMKDRDAGELLEGRLLLRAGNPRGFELIQAVAGRRPDLPAARLFLIQAAIQARNEFETAEKNFVEYRRICPASIGVFAYLHAVQDPAQRKAALDQAHGLLLGRSDPESIDAWRDVLDVLRVDKDPRLRTDTRLLRSLNLYDRDDWLGMMLTAYVDILDHKAREALRAEAARRRPDSRWAIDYAVDQWSDAHLRPPVTDQAGERQYRNDRARFLYDLWRKHENSPSALRNVSTSAADLSDEQLLQVIEAERRMEPNRANSTLGGFNSLSYARIFMTRKSHLEEARGLIESALREAEKEQPRSAYLPAAAASLGRAQTRFMARQLLVEYWLMRNNPGEARSILPAMKADLNALKAAMVAVPALGRGYTQVERAYEELEKRLGAEAK